MAEQGREHLDELLKEFETAMLVTQSRGGDLRARPMALAKTHLDEGLWFPTSRETGKLEEIEAHSKVGVTLQSKKAFISISGHAQVVSNREKIEALWSDTWKPWFPAGKDDPDLVLLKVIPDEGEYWDLSGSKGLKFLLGAAKAVLDKDRDPSADAGQHDKIRRI